MTDGYDIQWRVTWVDRQGVEHTRTLPLIAASMLVGELMGGGIQIIAIRDNAWWLESQLDQAEVATVGKSPYAGP